MATESFDDTFANLLKEDNATNAAGNTSINKPDVPNPPAPAAPAVDPAAAAAAAPVVDPAAAPVVEATGDEPASEIEGVEGAEGAEGAEDTKGEPPPPPEAKNATDDALARLADMLAQRAPQPPPQPARVEAQPAPPAFNQEETAFLTQYMTDFPDVAKAEGLLRRAEYQALTAHIFREMAGYFAPKLALLEQLADGAAYSAVVQRIPKYDEMRDSVAAWVATQPAYLQGGMNHVIQQGTAEEIADLFDRFTQATGAAAPQAGIVPQPGKTPPAPALKSAPELSPAVKQAAARLAPVSGKRSAPTQAAPLDFNSAFDEFAKAG